MQVVLILYTYCDTHFRMYHSQHELLSKSWFWFQIHFLCNKISLKKSCIYAKCSIFPIKCTSFVKKTLKISFLITGENYIVHFLLIHTLLLILLFPCRNLFIFLLSLIHLSHIRYIFINLNFFPVFQFSNFSSMNSMFTLT